MHYPKEFFSILACLNHGFICLVARVETTVEDGSSIRDFKPALLLPLAFLFYFIFIFGNYLFWNYLSFFFRLFSSAPETVPPCLLLSGWRISIRLNWQK